MDAEAAITAFLVVVGVVVIAAIAAAIFTNQPALTYLQQIAGAIH